MEILIIGILLGGSYALMAMGLQLQYGVSRIMNIANGEFLVAGSFAAFWLFTAWNISPILTGIIVAPLAFIANWFIYRIFLQPLVRRARSQGQLEVSAILSTFGLTFIMVGVMVMAFGGDYFSYSYLADPVHIFNQPYALNRIVAFIVSAAFAAALYIWLHRTRMGTALRAVAVSPEAACLVGINVPKVSAFAFAAGGAVVAAGGALLSMYLTFDVSFGLIFTMKALVIVIMGGVTEIRGTIFAAFILGLAETFVASVIDPGLSLAAAYALFIAILLLRPHGLFGRGAS